MSNRIKVTKDRGKYSNNQGDQRNYWENSANLIDSDSREEIMIKHAHYARNLHFIVDFITFCFFA